MKKTLSKFWKIYIGAVGGFLVLLAIALCLLWGVLSDYEQSLPRSVVEKAFATYIQTGKFSELFESQGVSFEFEDKENVINYLKENCTDELSFYKTVETENGEKYAVKSGEEKVLTLSVEKTGEETKFGFAKYGIKTVETNSSVGKIVIKAPKDYEVKVNGKSVAKSYITETDIKSDTFEYMPENVNGIYYDKYIINGLMFEPAVSAFWDGKETTVNFDAQAKEYVATALNNDELQQEINDYSVSAVKAYAAYLQEDGSLQEVRKYFDTSSLVYKKIQSNQMWVLDHNGCYFRNIETSEFYSYTQSVVSCRIKMEQVLRGIGNKKDYIDYIDVTIYMQKNNAGKYLIYNIQNHK